MDSVILLNVLPFIFKIMPHSLSLSRFLKRLESTATGNINDYKSPYKNNNYISIRLQFVKNLPPGFD